MSNGANTPRASDPQPKGGRPGAWGLGPVRRGALVPPADALHRAWGWLLALGIMLLIGGTAALLMPFLASVTVSAIVGATLLVCGAVQVLHVFSAPGWRAGVWSGLAGALYLIGGGVILADPLAGLVALTLVMIVVFFGQGVVRLVLGLRMRPEQGWGWLAAGGALSAALAVGLFLLFPGVSQSLLGILLGVSLIFEGWGVVFVALAARRAARLFSEV